MNKKVSILGAALTFCLLAGMVQASTVSSVSTSGTGSNGTSTVTALFSSTNTAVVAVQNSLAALPAAQQKQAILELSGEGISNAVGGGIGAAGTFAGGMAGHVGEVRAAMASMPEGAAGPSTANAGMGLGVWARGLASWVDQDNMTQNSANRLGYESDTQGFIIGVDKAIDQWIFGVSTGCTWTDVDTNDIDSDTDVFAWQVGPYISFATKTWYVDAGFNYADSDIDSERRIAFLGRTAKGDTDSDTYNSYLNAGYNFVFGQTTVTPFGGMQYVYSDMDGYKETGAAGANLEIGDEDTDSFTTTLGVRGAYAFNQKFSVNASAAWNHEYVDDTPTVNARFTGGNWFEVEGLKPDNDSWTFGVGCTGQINDAISAFVNYDYTTKDEFDNHNVTAGVRFDF